MRLGWSEALIQDPSLAFLLVTVFTLLFIWLSFAKLNFYNRARMYWQTWCAPTSHVCKCLNEFADHKIMKRGSFCFYEPLCQQQIHCLENLFRDTIQSELSLPLNFSNRIGVHQSSLHASQLAPGYVTGTWHNEMCGSRESFRSELYVVILSV